jgi:hypothetical protein
MTIKNNKLTRKRSNMKGGDTTKPSDDNIDKAKQYIAGFNSNSNAIARKIPKTINNTNYKGLQDIIPHLKYLENKYSNPGVFARMFKSKQYKNKLALTKKALKHAQSCIQRGKESKTRLTHLQY